jgi:hypothetical protein
MLFLQRPSGGSILTTPANGADTPIAVQRAAFSTLAARVVFSPQPFSRPLASNVPRIDRARGVATGASVYKLSCSGSRPRRQYPHGREAGDVPATHSWRSYMPATSPFWSQIRQLAEPVNANADRTENLKAAGYDFRGMKPVEQTQSQEMVLLVAAKAGAT